MTEFGTLQPLVLGAILAYTGLGKLLFPGWRAGLERTALARVIPPPHLGPAFRALGAAELGTALALLAPPTYLWEQAWVLALALGFVSYQVISAVLPGDLPCPCAGPATARSHKQAIARAGLLVVLAAAAFASRTHWSHTLALEPQWAVVPLFELLLVAALSPEMRARGPVAKSFSTAGSVGQTPPTAGGEPGCATAQVPLWDSLHVLKASPAFSDFAAHLRGAEPREHWRDGCWRFVSYNAVHDGRGAIAVFAIPIDPDPLAIRAVLVDECDDVVLASHSPERPVQPFPAPSL